MLTNIFAALKATIKTKAQTSALHYGEAMAFRYVDHLLSQNLTPEQLAAEVGELSKWAADRAVKAHNFRRPKVGGGRI